MSHLPDLDRRLWRSPCRLGRKRGPSIHTCTTQFGDVLFFAAQSAAVAPRKEVPSLIHSSSDRPADVYLPNWLRGQLQDREFRLCLWYWLGVRVSEEGGPWDHVPFARPRQTPMEITMTVISTLQRLTLVGAATTHAMPFSR